MNFYKINFQIGRNITFIVTGFLNNLDITKAQFINELSLINSGLRFWINNNLAREGFRLSFEELSRFLDTINYYSIYKIVSYSNRLSSEMDIYWSLDTIKDIPLRQVLDVTIPSEECSICFEPLIDSKVCGNMKCIHLYHCKCIDEWIKTPDVFGDREFKKCPICRANLIVFEADDNRYWAAF